MKKGILIKVLPLLMVAIPALTITGLFLAKVPPPGISQAMVGLIFLGLTIGDMVREGKLFNAEAGKKTLAWFRRELAWVMLVFFVVAIFSCLLYPIHHFHGHLLDNGSQWQNPENMAGNGNSLTGLAGSIVKLANFIW